MSVRNAGLELLPRDIAHDAVDLTKFGVNEWAIPGRHALAACRILTSSGLVILGGDYWLKASDGFQSAADGWAMTEIADEGWEVYVGRALEAAERAIDVREAAYIGLDPYLVLVAASEEDYRRLKARAPQSSPPSGQPPSGGPRQIRWR